MLTEHGKYFFFKKKTEFWKLTLYAFLERVSEKTRITGNGKTWAVQRFCVRNGIWELSTKLFGFRHHSNMLNELAAYLSSFNVCLFTSILLFVKREYTKRYTGEEYLPSFETNEIIRRLKEWLGIKCQTCRWTRWSGRRTLMGTARSTMKVKHQPFISISFKTALTVFKENDSQMFLLFDMIWRMISHPGSFRICHNDDIKVILLWIKRLFLWGPYDCGFPKRALFHPSRRCLILHQHHKAF